MFEAVLVSATCQGIVDPLPSSHPFASLICSLPGTVEFFDLTIVRSQGCWSVRVMTKRSERVLIGGW